MSWTMQESMLLAISRTLNAGIREGANEIGVLWRGKSWVENYQKAPISQGPLDEKELRKPESILSAKNSKLIRLTAII